MKSKKTTTTFDGRNGVGDEVLELPKGILHDDTGQEVGNERAKIRTLLSNNNQGCREVLSFSLGPLSPGPERS